jgi:hypothetical protein
MVEHADECFSMLLSDSDTQLLKRHYELVKSMPFFHKNVGAWPVEV